MDYLLLIIAGFFAGIMNTAAGGGTFLTLPALILSGVPPVAANATSTVAVSPGYIGGVVGFRSELACFPRPRLLQIATLSIFGGLAGSLLLLISSDQAFSLIVPVLLAVATMTFAYADRVQTWAAKTADQPSSNTLSLLIVSVYGGYFNGGLGIVLLALFASWGMKDLDIMNAVKSGVSLILSLISVLTFSLAGLVSWSAATVMMLAAILGGYAGAPIAKALPRKVLRAIIIIVGATMSLAFLIKALM